MAGKPGRRDVVPSKGGTGWDVEKPHGKVVSHHQTQANAEKAAKTSARRAAARSPLTAGTAGSETRTLFPRPRFRSRLADEKRLSLGSRPSMRTVGPGRDGGLHEVAPSRGDAWCVRAEHGGPDHRIRSSRRRTRRRFLLSLPTCDPHDR